MTPPRLTDLSTNRLHAVVEAADAAVDGGAAPNAALAKAAQDCRLPVGHVPLAVRAFNTGRAVRQLDTGSSPWEKAAAHPIASVPGVLEALEAQTAPTIKVANDLSDYLEPPTYSASAPAPTAPVPPLALSVEKRATAPAPPRPNQTSTILKVAAALDALRAAVGSLTPAAYGTIKAAAERFAPAEAAFAFSAIEAQDFRLHKKAELAVSAGHDPTVANTHPALEAVRSLAAARDTYVPPPTHETPFGYRKEAVGDNGQVMFARLPVHPLLGIYLPDTPPTPTPIQAGRTTLLDGGGPTPEKSASAGSILTSPLRGFGSVTSSALSPFTTNRFSSRAADSFKMNDSMGAKPYGMSGGADRLRSDLDRIDEQAAVQDLLMDSRLQRADPKMVIETYRQLSGLAPQAMRNPAVAADFIVRRIQTGPPSYFDLEKLVSIEKNLAAARRVQTGDDDNN